ncbi:MAG: hypothetical protein WCR31_06410 [Treponema sp.]
MKYLPPAIVDKVEAAEIKIKNRLYGSGVNGSFEFDADGNLTCTNGAVTARDLSISGFAAGDVLLRKLPDTATFSGGTAGIFSQICGTGTVRLSFVPSVGDVKYILAVY